MLRRPELITVMISMFPMMISITPMMMTTWIWVLNERHSINPTFSQCICCSLSRSKTSDILFFITLWTGWWRDQHLCQEGEVYKHTNVSQNRVLLWRQVKYPCDLRLLTIVIQLAMEVARRHQIVLTKMRMDVSAL